VIGLDRTLCGLDKHVVAVTQNKNALVDERPEFCAWIGPEKINADPHCLRTLFELEAIPFSVDPPQRYQALADMFGKSPWELVHPTRRLWWALDKIKEATKHRNAEGTRYQWGVFAPTSQLFDLLRPWRVDPAVKDSSDANAITCVSEDGWLQPPTYNRFGTRTGRLTVTEGPRVLTVRHDTRELFRAIDDEHELVQFDYSALEARVALALAGRELAIDSDPYHVIAELMGSKERDEAKSATFSALYSDPTAKTQRDPRVSKVRRIFKLGEIFTSLKKNKEENGCVRNLYGRLIPEPIEETLYNNYVQSTGADVVLLGFKQLIPTLLELEIVPHFFLHDALYASVPRSMVREAAELASKGVSVKDFELPFPIKASIVGERPIV